MQCSTVFLFSNMKVITNTNKKFISIFWFCFTSLLTPSLHQIVDQESLEPVETIKRPVVFCVAVWFGKVRLIDNMEIDV